MRIGLLFFSAASSDPRGGYEVLLRLARYADEAGLHAVWTPERHFEDFGGLYPNPSGLGAALAVTTRRIRIRAGSVVAPLHHPVRLAEEWAVVDNLSGGRVEVSFASGWNARDFALALGAYGDRRTLTVEAITTVRRLWAGESVSFPTPDGEAPVRTHPRPLQEDVPVWLTAAGSPQTFRDAGRLGAGVLSALVGQSLDRFAENVAAYRAERAAAGHRGRGQVALMLHTFLGHDDGEVRRRVREPLRDYMRSYIGQHEELRTRLGAASAREREALAAFAFEHYYRTDSLLGTPDKCAGMLERVAAAGADEVACLVDFGLPGDEVLASLELLTGLRDRAGLEAPC